MLPIQQKDRSSFESITKKPFRCVEFLQQMPKFQPMGKPDIDDGSGYAPAIDDEPPDNDLDVDFDDGSDDDKKPASKPSAKSASKVTVNNQNAPMGSALKCPPGRSKTKSAKAAGTAAMKTNTPASSDYAKLVASSEAIYAVHDGVI
jgi:hypothetical protein